MSPRVVIAGGYGLVGGLVARHLRAAGHELDLVLAGRNPDQGASLAAELGARTARLDVADPAAALAELGPVDLVVAPVERDFERLTAAAVGAVFDEVTVGGDVLRAATGGLRGKRAAGS